MYTDSYFAYPFKEAVEFTFNYTKQPVFLYELTYPASIGFSQIFGNAVTDNGETSNTIYYMHIKDILNYFCFLSKDAYAL